MDFGGFAWNLLKLVAPIVLIVVIVWAIMHNRATRRAKDDTERATHRLYEEEDEAHRGEDDDVP
jgi:hypothetical protein